MHTIDPARHEIRAPVGFLCLVLPAAGPTVVRLVAPAPEYGDYTPGTGPRLGWPLPVKWTDTCGKHRYAWCGERRNLPDLPANADSLVLAARLGHADLADRIGLRGDLLLAGVDPDGAPTDVPETVLEAALAAVLLTHGARDVAIQNAQPIRVGLPAVPTQ